MNHDICQSAGHDIQPWLRSPRTTAALLAQHGPPRVVAERAHPPLPAHQTWYAPRGIVPGEQCLYVAGCELTGLGSDGAYVWFRVGDFRRTVSFAHYEMPLVFVPPRQDYTVELVGWSDMQPGLVLVHGWALSAADHDALDRAVREA